MKPKYYCLLACLLLGVAGSMFAAQTIPVRMYCLSIEVDHGIGTYGDSVDLNFSDRNDGAGEVGPWWPFGPGYYDIQLPETFGYISLLYVNDKYYRATFSGTLNITLPMDTDANNNRFPDFFEVSLGANVQTTGAYSLYCYPVSSSTEYGSINATWTRSPGSYTGTYQWDTFNLSGPLPYGDWYGTFTGTFKILQYTGTMTYTPGSPNVTATINLTQTGVSTNTRQGSITFVKADGDPFNSLTNKPGILMDANSNTYNFTNHYFFRDPNYPTNYAGYVEFDDDGDLSSVYPYAIWVLSINDPNDSNNNGIPDFSDTASGVTLPRQPMIQMATTSSNLLFTIHGDINHMHQVQKSPSLDSPNWQPVISVTLTNDPQVVPVAFPSGTAFFRVQAQ